MHAIYWDIFLVLALILASGLLALAEFAISSARKSRLRDWSSRGYRGAGLALGLRDDVHSRSAAPAHLHIGVQRGVHRERLDGIAVEPLRQFAYMSAAGVIEVLARCEKLHGLRSGAGKNVQQPRMQPMTQEDVRRNGLQHG